VDARRKRHLKRSLKLAPYLLVLLMSGGYALVEHNIDSKEQAKIEEIKDDIIEDNNESISENNITAKEENQVIVKEEPVEQESVEEVKVTYSSELLDSGYEFETIDFDTLKQINDSASAWIKIDGTNIDYPIVTGSDNEYYLHHDIEGNKSKSGTLFTDFRNNPLDDEKLNDITFIYGHHMKGGKMLAQICNYKDENFYKEHDFGVIYTPDGYAYKITPLSCIVVDGNDEAETFVTNFENQTTYMNYIKKINEQSKIETNTCVKPGDKLLALVTCSYETTNSRCIVYFKMEKQYTNINQIENNVNKTLNR